jgi:2-polyprenyl-3-methyl-5-hydroxy-6-metoxy-1,4-benzoquinol methylase
MISPQPSSDEIKEFYCQEYFEKDHSCGIKAKTYFEDEGRVQEKAKQALELISKFKTEGKLLEVGCAGGLFLRESQKRGFSVSGLDISAEIAKEAGGKLGIAIKVGDFETYFFGQEKFDIVCMFDAFEHFANPLSVLAKAKQVLETGGLLFIDIPTTKNAFPYRLSSLVLRELRKNRIVETPPYHLFEYTPGTLQRMAIKAGFKISLVKKYSTPPWKWENGDQGVIGNALLTATRAANHLVSGPTGLFSDRMILIVSKPEERP